MEKQENATVWLKSPLSEKKQRMQPMVDVVLRPYFGRKRKLRLYRTEYKIGRDASCDIVIDDPHICPQHAMLRLEQQGSGYFIEDLSSKNGTFLNGTKVFRAPLYDNGILRLGRSSFSWASAMDVVESGKDWIVSDPFMLQLLKKLRQVSQSSLPILLLGETGTGKEILARLIHQWSQRNNGPYIAMNAACASGELSDSELFGHQKGAYTGSDASRKGALRSANHGTFFLDEVADMPMASQVKLLRSIELGEVKPLGSDRAERVDFRLVSATSQNLLQKVSDGQFRLDLYYRIAGSVIRIPPLRERPKDILAITKNILKAKGFDWEQEVEGHLLSHLWPGNVRELKSCLDQAMVSAREDSSARVMLKHINKMEATPFKEEENSQPKTLEEKEREWIRFSLERNGWSRSVAAKELGIARSTLFEKMRRFGLRDRA